MGKYIFQFAGTGILFLLGIGVEMMPGNTSWIPSIIIWAVASLWLIIVAIFLLKRKRGKRDRLALIVTILCIKIGKKVSSNSFLLLVTVKFQPLAPIQLGKLDLEYDGKPYEPMEFPTKFVERIETYEVKYKVDGFIGDLEIKAGLLEEQNIPENKWPQGYLHVLAGDLNFNTEKVPVPTPTWRLDSDKKGSQN